MQSTIHPTAIFISLPLWNEEHCRLPYRLPGKALRWRSVRKEIDVQLAPDLGGWLDELGQLRRDLLQEYEPSEGRKMLLHKLASPFPCANFRHVRRGNSHIQQHWIAQMMEKYLYRNTIHSISCFGCLLCAWHCHLQPSDVPWMVFHQRERGRSRTGLVSL